MMIHAEPKSMSIYVCERIKQWHFSVEMKILIKRTRKTEKNEK